MMQGTAPTRRLLSDLSQVVTECTVLPTMDIGECLHFTAQGGSLALPSESRQAKAGPEQ